MTARKKTRSRFLIFIPLLALVALGSLFYFGERKDSRAFAISVDPERKMILGDETPPDESTPLLTHIVLRAEEILGESSQKIVVAIKNSWPMQIASPGVTYIWVSPGMRKEEIAENLAQKLNWNKNEEENFLSSLPSFLKGSDEGYLAPGAYAVSLSENPEEIRQKMVDQFHNTIGIRYGSSTNTVVSLDTALKIASIIQREAAGQHDMRLISGIIWNRIFDAMNLDVDATLQYAKASIAAEKISKKGVAGAENINWWPKVMPEDKKIDSLYNTYKYLGLPPTPISNVTASAVEAALNPARTPCLFYLHDRWQRIHCSQTYEGHVANIKAYLR